MCVMRTPATNCWGRQSRLSITFTNSHSASGRPESLTQRTPRTRRTQRAVRCGDLYREQYKRCSCHPHTRVCTTSCLSRAMPVTSAGSSASGSCSRSGIRRVPLRAFRLASEMTCSKQRWRVLGIRPTFFSRPTLLHPLLGRQSKASAASITPEVVNGVSLVSLFVGVCISNRPVGWSSPAVEVRESPVSGKGVFAVASIEAETVIGRYPGLLRTAQEILDKAERAPSCKAYAFQIDDGRFWDPTDANGKVSSRPGPGMPWIEIDPTLAYVNEPVVGGNGCNVTVENGASQMELVFRTIEEIPVGAEIFVDYGTQYDRSSYK
eukprot:jgi/Ulvmu1/1805/UM119_0023.1